MPWAEALIASKSNQLPIPLEGRVLSYVDALNEALALALGLDPNVIVLGQGVNDPKGMFGVTTDLYKNFGTERVFDTPLSEEGLFGICTGAAMNGIRPVYLHNRPDFLLLAFNQIVTHASKVHYMDNGETNVPLVAWAAIGRGWGSGAQHSQAIQGLLLGVPGLKIVMPSTPYDAKGLLLAAIADNNPVLIFEHRWCMRNKGVVPEGMYEVSLGKGVYRRKGNDLTIAGTSHSIELATQAVDELAETGIPADVIDLRTLKPLDEDELKEAVRKAVFKSHDDKSNDSKEKILFTIQSGFKVLLLDDIIYLEGQDNYTEVNFNGGQLLVSKTLKDYENLLNYSNFYRIH